MTTRAEALQVKCPFCHAGINTRCIGKRHLRLAIHRERYHACKAIKQVRDGFMSVRHAASLFNWTVDDVCEAAFGEVVL